MAERDFLEYEEPSDDEASAAAVLRTDMLTNPAAGSGSGMSGNRRTVDVELPTVKCSGRLKKATAEAKAADDMPQAKAASRRDAKRGKSKQQASEVIQAQSTDEPVIEYEVKTDFNRMFKDAWTGAYEESSTFKLFGNHGSGDDNADSNTFVLAQSDLSATRGLDLSSSTSVSRQRDGYSNLVDAEMMFESTETSTNRLTSNRVLANPTTTPHQPPNPTSITTNFRFMRTDTEYSLPNLFPPASP